MAEDDVADVLAVHMGTGQRFTHHQRAQFGGGDVFQAAAKGSDGGAHAAYNYNFTGHGFVSRGGW